MPANIFGKRDDFAIEDPDVSPREFVAGLRWDPLTRAPEETAPVDLDIACALLDDAGGIVEIIHPRNPRHSNDALIHSGDSHTGSGSWDDECIFVFPDAVPASVTALAFVVATIGGRTFSEVPNAVCHLSERATEREWVRTELGGLGALHSYCFATLYRSASGWSVCAGARDARLRQVVEAQVLARLLHAKL
jgi:tellurium resistance protein TerZ